MTNEKTFLPAVWLHAVGANMKRQPRVPVMGGLILLGVVLGGCSKHQYLTGYYDRQGFIDAVAWRRKVETGYRPDAAAMQRLQQADSFSIRMYMATWCHDSKKWTPRLLALSPQLPLQQLELIPVDTTKRDPRGWAQRDGLRFTPTIVVLRGGRELGRIIEAPKRDGKPVRLEEALADLAAK